MLIFSTSTCEAPLVFWVKDLILPWTADPCVMQPYFQRAQLSKLKFITMKSYWKSWETCASRGPRVSFHTRCTSFSCKAIYYDLLNRAVQCMEKTHFLVRTEREFPSYNIQAVKSCQPGHLDPSFLALSTLQLYFSYNKNNICTHWKKTIQEKMRTVNLPSESQCCLNFSTYYKILHL